MSARISILNLLTHRDYGPVGKGVVTGFLPPVSSRRLNLTYPRGEITSETAGA